MAHLNDDTHSLRKQSTARHPSAQTTDKMRVFVPGKELLIGLAIVGWIVLTLQFFELSLRGSVGSYGFGMALLDPLRSIYAQAEGWQALIYSLCVTDSIYWNAVDFTKALTMWLSMVLAMMVPTLLPLFSNSVRAPLPFRQTGTFVSGYLLAWTSFCLAAVAVQWSMRSSLVIDESFVSVTPVLNGLILIAAGLYQVSAQKRHHLKACRLSLKRLRRKQPDHALLKEGLSYGARCIGCCWPLMATMFVFGLMNIIAMAALTLVMVSEKIISRSDTVLKLTSCLLIGTGVLAIISVV